MYTNSKSRRQFLVGSAQTLVALPFLPSLWPREAWGQTLPMQKRFIGSWVPLGGYANADLYPTYTADQAVTFPQSGHSIYSTNLRISPEHGSISKIYSSKLNPYLPKLTLLRGLDCPIGFSHGEATQLGHMRQVRGGSYADPNTITEDTMIQYPAVPFIDQLLAFSPEMYASAPLVRSVVGYGMRSMGQVIPGDINSGLKHVGGPSNPVALFNLLFGPATPSVTNTGPSASQIESTTLIDQTLGDLKSILSHRNISSTDKQRLDAFTTELFETQKKLNIVTAAVCSAPATPTSSTSMGSIATNIDREVFLDLYTSILAAGIKCGRTSVATLHGIMAVETQGAYSFDNLHTWGHDSGKTAEVGDAMRWFVDKAIVPLISKLDVDEGGGSTFLDNSLIMFGNQNSTGYHKNWDRNILLAGGAGGYFKTGQFVDYRQRGVSTNYGQPGILYNQLIITILKSMGIKDSNPYLKEYAKADLIVPPVGQEWWSTLRKDNKEHPHKDVIRESGNVLPLIVK
jgi:hypothetical protein